MHIWLIASGRHLTSGSHYIDFLVPSDICTELWWRNVARDDRQGPAMCKVIYGPIGVSHTLAADSVTDML